jgi:hypothetical protein
VPFRQATGFAQALAAAGIPVTTRWITSRGHGVRTATAMNNQLLTPAEGALEVEAALEAWLALGGCVH